MEGGCVCDILLVFFFYIKFDKNKRTLLVVKMCLESFDDMFCNGNDEDDDDNSRKPLLSFEERLLTFKNWHGAINPIDLAKAGFYFTLYKDVCQCVYCFIEIYKWEVGDSAIDEHYKNAKHCDLACILWSSKRFVEEEEKTSASNNIKTDWLFIGLFFLPLIVFLVQNIV